MAEKKLGRGLDFLITRSGVAERGTAGYEVIPTHLINCNPSQPRQQVSDESIKELATSIQEAGLMQPVVLREVPGGYELIAGERRLRACRVLGWETIPALVRQVDPSRRLEMALIENVQRRNLNPIEYARALRELMATLELTQEEVAAKIGKQRSTVANLLRLLELPDDIQEHVSRGTLTMGHARALASLPGDTTKRALVKEILDGNLSVRSVERRAALARARAAQPAEVPPYLAELQQKLEEALGMRVKIVERAGRGKVTIRFRDHKEFDRLFARLTGSLG